MKARPDRSPAVCSNSVPEASWNTMPPKAPSPMDVTETGMETELGLSPENAPSPMDVTTYSTPPNSRDPGISRLDSGSSTSHPATATSAGSRDVTS